MKNLYKLINLLYYIESIFYICELTAVRSTADEAMQG